MTRSQENPRAPLSEASQPQNENQNGPMNQSVKTPLQAIPAHAPSDHPALPTAKIGVLLINLGTPDAADASAVKRYLAEFLSDRRIVDLPRALWLPILHGVILNVRPAKTAEAYRAIWREDTNESPLRYYTRRSAEKLAGPLGARVMVDWAMRYGTPSIEERVAALKDAGCTRILAVPLYPQYSATTTGSVHDALFDAFKTLRWQPALRTAPAFHDHPAYIKALAATTRRALNGLDWTPERFVMSFHGLPKRYFEAGDPYHCHCAKTARLLRAEMGWSEQAAPLTFQSKFGREPWLEPATDATIEAMGEAGIRDIAVIMPGFMADCIETLEEIDIAARESFTDHGGRRFLSIPCLNDSDEAIDLLSEIIRTETAGWL